MNRNKWRQAVRSILLLTDDVDVREKIDSALAAHALSHRLHLAKDLQQFLASQMDAEPEDVIQIDLLLLAYVNDQDRVRQVLQELSLIERWKAVPTIAFLSKEQLGDAKLLYHLGCNSVLRYPLHFETLKELIVAMDQYWFGVVSLPLPPESDDPS